MQKCAKYSIILENNAKKLSNFCQSGKISQNLVTLKTLN